jgi:hypothetical protein
VLRADEKSRRRRKRWIGVRELVSIPEWGLSDLEAKVDTGAYTSSIDVSRVIIFGQDGEGRAPYAEITFGTGDDARTVVAPVIGFRRVRNPSGHVTNRPIVEARLELGGKRFRTAINLHRRVGMRCCMIIGRRALAGRFVVDVSRRGRGVTRR